MLREEIWLHGLRLVLCTCGCTCCSGASYMMYPWGWLALIIPITSLMLSETGDSSMIACIFSSTSAALTKQKRERGCFEWIDASVHSKGRHQRQRNQLRGVHTHRHHWEEQSRAQQITDLQLTCWANQDSQPHTSLTRGSQCIVRLTGVYSSPSPSTYVGCHCYVAAQVVCLLKLSSSCRR